MQNHLHTDPDWSERLAAWLYDHRVAAVAAGLVLAALAVIVEPRRQALAPVGIGVQMILHLIVW